MYQETGIAWHNFGPYSRNEFRRFSLQVIPAPSPSSSAKVGLGSKISLARIDYDKF